MSLKLTVSAIALFIAAPALAADRGYLPPPPQPMPVYPFVTGDLSVALGGETLTYFEDETEHAGMFVGDARVSLPVAGMANLELELYGEGRGNFGLSTVVYSPTAHLWARLPNAAFGVFAGATMGDTAPIFAPVTTGVVGAEGEMYLNNVTLGIQGNYNWISPGSEDNHYWALRGYANWYFTPDFKGVIDVKYTGFPNFDFDDVSANSWTFSGTLEGHIPGLPITLFGSGAYTVEHVNGEKFVDGWQGLAGVKVLLDPPGTSLVMHDRALPFTYHNSNPQFFLGGL